MKLVVNMIIIVLIMFLFISIAYAETVYKGTFGDWQIVGEQSGDDMLCKISTRWHDETRIDINIYPDRNEKQYSNMTIFNPSWDLPDEAVDMSMDLDIDFYGVGFGYNKQSYPFYVVSKNTIVFKYLSVEFDKYFKSGSLMVLFPEMDEEIKVSLKGTTEIGYALTDCLHTVRSTQY